jgi:hypothetical protein
MQDECPGGLAGGKQHLVMEVPEEVSLQSRMDIAHLYAGVDSKSEQMESSKDSEQIEKWKIFLEGQSRGTKQMERNLLKEMELVCEDRDTDTEVGQMKDPKEDVEAMAAGFLEDSQIDMDAEQI